MKRTHWLRKFAFWTHLWLGVLLGLPLALISLTGSVLVFGPELERVVYPQFMLSPDADPQREPLTWSEFEPHLHAKYPTEKIAFLHRTPGETDAYLVSIRDNSDWFPFDAWSGRALGTYKYEGTFLDWLYKIHIELVAGERGILVAGICGLFLVWLSLTGILLWWPRQMKQLRAALSIRWKAGWKRLNWDFHVTGGIFCALWLIILGYTGAMYNLPAVDKATKAALVREETAEPKSKVVKGARSISLAQMERVALGRFPGAQIVAIGYPDKPDGVFGVRVKQEGENSRYGDTELKLDRYSAQILQLQDGKAPRGEAALEVWQSRLHFGHFGGLPTRLMYIFVGLMPLVLWISGLLMWWNRAGVPRRRKRERLRREKLKDSSTHKDSSTQKQFF